LEQFKGLVVSEEEISGLLANDDGPLDDASPPEPTSPEAQAVAEALHRLGARIAERRAASLEARTLLSLPTLSRLFGLTRFDEQCLIICLAPELDRKYEKLYAYLQDDITQKKPSVDLVLRLACQTAPERLKGRLSFDPQAPLLKYRLAVLTEYPSDAPLPLLARSVKLDDRIANFLLDVDGLDARLESLACVEPPQPRPDHEPFLEEVRGQIGKLIHARLSDPDSDGRPIVFYVWGPNEAGKRSLARVVCGDIGLSLIVADARKLTCGRVPGEEILALLGRETVLGPAALCLENLNSLLDDEGKSQPYLRTLAEVTGTLSRLTFLLGTRSWTPQGLFDGQVFVNVPLAIPDFESRMRLWQSCMKGHVSQVSELDLASLAVQFRITPGQIRDAAAAAEASALWRSPESPEVTPDDLYAASRAQSRPRLGALATRVEPRRTWDDLVLPADEMDALIEISARARHRHVVHGDWGFERKLAVGLGLTVLFFGPSGTGKTMAAEVIASDLRLDLYKIDLSQVVSKYIGETEKHLDQIFREARTSAAILFFDEADALFGKRSEVRDAHDRYANIEVAYLLQKMEEYDGLVILATNLRQSLDDAFVRRIQVVVEFPFPDEALRERLWRSAFPREAPVGDDIDAGVLGREIRLPGGNIRNIALAAAFHAAGDGRVIRMAHLRRAARREYRKLGRVWDAGGDGSGPDAAEEPSGEGARAR
jgi:SpoVK/Ycf46/Vps4 family AAA+-type ATPase